MVISRLKISSCSSRQRGYSLGELMVTIAVLGILSSVAVPGMQNVVLNNRRVATTNDFVYTLQLARSEAIARNQRVTVCASRNGTNCTSLDYWSDGWIMFNDIDLDKAASSDGEEFLRKAANENELAIIPFGFRGSITYRPNGRAMGNTVATDEGEFVFCDSRGPDHARVVIIGASGRPRLSEKRSNGTTPVCE